jgi:two-component system, chemotaxis family, chemotaxis protein CheY
MPRPSRSALIVGDSAPLRRYTAASLEGIGISCTEATNGYQAMERLSEKLFSLYVLDLDMPPSDGLAIFAITLFGGYRDPSPVVIGYSARPAGEARQGPWPGNADLAALLPKPFHPAELIAAALAAFGEQPEDPSDL